MCRIQKDDKMHVRQTMLLKLYCPHSGHCTPHDPMLFQIIKQLSNLGMENMKNQIRAIRSSLSWKQFPNNLWPIGICSDNDEEISPMEVSINCKSILAVLNHIVYLQKIRKEEWCAAQFHFLLHWHLMPEHQLHLDMSLLIYLFGGSGCIENVPAHMVPMH